MSLTTFFHFYLILFFTITTPFLSARYQAKKTTKPLVTIMLDPAGDAKHAGRQIDDCFERGITLSCAEALKKNLEDQVDDVRVILTRFPGETLQPLQNANFANRLDVDLYIRLQFYHDTASKPSLYMYRFSCGDDFVSKTFDLYFYPYDKAHTLSNEKTKKWSSIIEKELSNATYQQWFHFKGMLALPVEPLIGIKSPAILLEAGLKNKDDWRNYLTPISNSIKLLLDEIKPHE